VIEAAVDLAAREAAILLTLALLGSGPVAFLPGTVPAAARVALAPAFGLALGLGAMLSAAQVMSMSVGAWAVFVPLCLLSAAIAAWRLRQTWRPGRLPLAHIISLAVALLVPILVFNAPFADQRTSGPAGYFIADAGLYAAQSFALEEKTWNSESFNPNLGESGFTGNRTLRKFFDGPFFQTGTAPLQAALNSTFGWRAIDSQTALMVAFVAIGALGCFGFLLAVTGSSWAAPLGALLFAGPVTYQLFIDASQAPLAALALLGAFAMTATRLVRDPLGAGALFGVLSAGVATAYPSYLPIVAGSALLALAVHLFRERDAGILRLSAAAFVAAILAAAVVAPLSLAKNASYFQAVSRGDLERNYGEALYETPVRTEVFGRPVPSPTLEGDTPSWHTPAEGVPAWLTGSRDLYSIPRPGETPLQRWLVFGALFPALMLALAALGARSFPAGRVLLYPAAVALVAAAYSYLIRDCGYCAERNILPLASLVAILGAAGAVAAARMLEDRFPGRILRLAPIALAFVMLVVPLKRDSALASRLTDGGAFLGEDARAVLDEAAKRQQAIAVEGGGLGAPHSAQIENTLLDAAASELFRRPPVIDWKGLPKFLYFPDDPPRNSDLDPRYGWVFTRLAGVRTPRHTVIRRGPFALERRRAPVDATITRGAGADLTQRDPRGDAWLTGPVTFTVAAPPRTGAVSLRIVLGGPTVSSVRLRGRATPLGTGAGAVAVCLPVPGSGAIRRATLRAQFERVPDQPPPDKYGGIPIPGKAVRIVSLRGLSRSCPSRREGPRLDRI
jgi:hypothetical protein